MAKSVRSKSLRKAKAIKRGAVYKPVDDARLNRLSQKLAGLADMMALDSSATSPVVLASDATSLAGPSRFRNRKKLAPFSAYGLSAKETKF